MRNGLLQRLVHVGLLSMLFHVVLCDSLLLSVLVSDSSPEPDPCEKWLLPPSQYALREECSKDRRRWCKMHHPIETDYPVNVLRAGKGGFCSRCSGKLACSV